MACVRHGVLNFSFCYTRDSLVCRWSFGLSCSSWITVFFSNTVFGSHSSAPSVTSDEFARQIPYCNMEIQTSSALVLIANPNGISKRYPWSRLYSYLGRKVCQPTDKMYTTCTSSTNNSWCPEPSWGIIFWSQERFVKVCLICPMVCQERFLFYVNTPLVFSCLFWLMERSPDIHPNVLLMFVMCDPLQTLWRMLPLGCVNVPLTFTRKKRSLKVRWQT